MVLPTHNVKARDPVGSKNDLTFMTNGHSFGVGFLSSFGDEIWMGSDSDSEK